VTRSLLDLYELTKTRLEAYRIFSARTIEDIAQGAKKQATYETSYAFFDAVGIVTPQLFVDKDGQGVPVLDIPAAGKEKGTIVIHLPMANPLDANQLYHIATVKATNPAYRIIAFGNPSGEPFFYKEQNLSFWKRFRIGTNREVRPLVAAELEYLEAHVTSDIHHVGYSYGAHKALIESSYVKSHTVKSLILIEPVAHPRGIKQLIEDFQRTFEPMGGYVNRTHLKTYFDARAEAARTKHHKNALKRPINIAIGFMMSRLDFIPLVKKIVSQQPQLKVTIAWGGKSELGNDAHVGTSLHQLSHDNPGRIYPLQLKDDTHAFANDIHLYAAIIHEALAFSES